ncbi:MAG: HDOD domain-containing protein [Candidatus Eisenbacteria bacterium]|uniref:HDOD domain-containing protein n=1 Tax=Eiseniibacteriota bacterium TaxID=2212470 RepID=A0A948WEJ0_UNCEI|nr:HDOD domain-containing protein [Candidatus Eisenbacteria bacterium]MBU1950354.1 HDOD domain-containing protein [Candidatus Eisenbacteria bacterium]MBU2692813.1 HDOD domain-containing protein [Candidatus Eisenbacteria bacterium]
MKWRILFVDDEPNVLQGLQRMLRGKRDEWDMDFAEGPQAALKILETKIIDVVISDIRMAGMNGVEFLTKVMEQYPYVARLALSGQADEQLTLQAVSPVQQYLSKPCEAEALIKTIERICALRDQVGGKDLMTLVMQLKTIPSIPSLYWEIVNELNKEEASLKKIGETISRDVGMTARILQLVNSAFFGLRREVGDPTHAVNLLGLDTVKNLVLSIQVFSAYDDLELESFSLDALWHHSMQTGMFAKDIAKVQGADRHLVENSMGAGMLHDVGKLILAANLPAEFGTAVKLAEEKKISIPEAELATFGATHASIGAYVLGLWGLPEAVVQAVAWHHSPSECPNAPSQFSALTAVHAANIIDHGTGGPEARYPLSEIDTAYIEKLHLSHRLDAWRDLCEGLEAEASKEEERKAG